MTYLSTEIVLQCYKPHFYNQIPWMLNKKKLLEKTKIFSFYIQNSQAAECKNIFNANVKNSTASHLVSNTFSHRTFVPWKLFPMTMGPKNLLIVSKNWDHLTMGTKCVGTHMFLGTNCPRTECAQDQMRCSQKRSCLLPQIFHV